MKIFFYLAFYLNKKKALDQFAFVNIFIFNKFTYLQINFKRKLINFLLILYLL